MVVRLSRAVNNDIIEICKDGFPNEVCGVLIGKMEKNTFKISSFIACKNLNKERSVDRYELDPKDYKNADQIAKEQSMDIIGIYHSHPNHPAIASDTDKLFAQERFIYLIYSIYDKEYKDLIAWALNEQQSKMEEVLIEIS